MQNVPSGSGPQAAATSAATSAATLSATTTANATAARGISTLLELKNGQTRRYQGALACAVEAISKEGEREREREKDEGILDISFVRG